MTTATLESILLTRSPGAARAASLLDARAERGHADPPPVAPGQLLGVSRGVVRAAPDGVVQHPEGVPHPTIELVAQGAGALWTRDAATRSAPA
jgi:hypothetical protein